MLLKHKPPNFPQTTEQVVSKLGIGGIKANKETTFSPVVWLSGLNASL